MNSIIASNINGGTVLNQQVADGSRSSLLLSSIDFSLTEIKSNFTPSSNQGHCLVKLSGKEKLLNGQHKNIIGNSIVAVNGTKEKSPEDCIPVPKVQLFDGKIHTEWRQVYKIGAGLSNLGNTCFMNTVIQCLTYCPPLANYLLHDNEGMNHSSKCSTTGFCMMCLLQRHLRRAIGKTGEVIKPVDFYQRLKTIAKHFQFGRQEDAHEFLRYVIDHLWKACLPQTNGLSKLDSASKETTVINSIFGGYHRSQVICLKCKKESNTFDHFMDFILDIKQNVTSLEKALQKFIQPEILQQENCYKCPNCKMKVDAKKQFSVYRSPTVATFQLKRFDSNQTFGGKITKQISYPEKINLRPYMSENKGEPIWYRLNAVLVHSGSSCNSGHYYCYVKNSNGLWYIMDDQTVSQVSSTRVLDESAYVLFYIKTMDRAKILSPKCVEVKQSYSKKEIPNTYFEKSVATKTSSSDSSKATPLSEKVNVTKSSPPLSSPVILRKSNWVSSPVREKVSFGFRPSPSTNIISPKSKTTFGCQPPPVVASPGGLVPYNEGSSDSSDEGGTMNQSNGRLPTNSQDASFEKSKTTKTSSPDSCKATPLGEKMNGAKSSPSVSSSNGLQKSNWVSTPSAPVSFGFRPGLSPNAFTPKLPTWKNESYERSSIVPDYERKRPFDEFDEDYDRGKVRKSKRKDDYHYYDRKNPFQKHSESYQRNYNGKYYNSNQYHHRKPYYSHSNWKSKESSYHRYRNHHQRYY